MLDEQRKENPEPYAYDYPDTAHALGDCSVNHVRNLASKGLLTKIYLGRRAMITTESIKRLVESGGTGVPEDKRERDAKGHFVESAVA